MNTSSAQVARRSYLPFGAQWAASGTGPTDFGFTGQREAAEIGLYYYVARWLDPEIGHFAQADTIVPGAGNPAAYNRYAYVNYNSLRYIDPSGHFGDDVDPKIIQQRLENTCTGDFRYCLLNNGAIFDRSHFNDRLAFFFWDDLVNKYESGIANGSVLLEQSGTGFSFTAVYHINFTGIENQSQLAQIAAGIWQDFQIQFEHFQSEVYPLGVGNITGSTIEDIPSTYLALVAEIRGYTLDEVINILGGGRQYPVSSIEKLATLVHGKNDSINMINILTGDLVLYPEELSITPNNDSSIWNRMHTSSKTLPGFAGSIIDFWNGIIGE